MHSLPPEYLERVYAGVLGKIIGVYLGRPFEGWTHQRILEELGPIRYFVHDELGLPLVVVDDDISGTFVFVRALEEHGCSVNLSSEAVGKTWLNQVVERRSVFWWGGRGISTEHTAFLNLRAGIPAPLSGCMQTNGKLIAEQIGGQIFIDGWALVAPGNPDLATRLAGVAASVSHDGEAVHAARLWAAMEAEAFLSRDVDHLLDTGLSYIPADSVTARLIVQIRDWVKQDKSWTRTRQRIEDTHGYDKFGGVCHVIPNHGIMIMALLYAPHSFHEAMHIINTCGWDTDCNSGNLGCLVALINGLDCLNGGDPGPDWRGPLADRAFISSADGGGSITNAARIATELANIGRQLAGHAPLKPPKDGAQFHFTLPGSVQGFQASSGGVVEQAEDGETANRPGLAIRLASVQASRPPEPVEVMTPTFAPKEALQLGGTYDLMACPLVYPGQVVKAVLRAPRSNACSFRAHLRLRVYGPNDSLMLVRGPSSVLEPGASAVLEWTIADDMDSQPIQQLGVGLNPSALDIENDEIRHDAIWLDSLGWSGAPRMTLRRPSRSPGGTLWKRAWVNSIDDFPVFLPPSFCIAKDNGEGIITQGTREWTDYQVAVRGFCIIIGGPAGVAVRVRGLNRYYALMFVDGGSRLSLVKALDERRIDLASVVFQWKCNVAYTVRIVARGSLLHAEVEGTILEALDDQYGGGGLGLVVTDGSLSAQSIDVEPIASK